jgi:serine/threonine protein kinase
LNACHLAGVAHRDLKVENILLDSQGNVKIADFGFAGPHMGKDGDGYLKTFCGTELYMAPEIHMKKSYVGTQVDIFATGIILFMMVLANPPFGKAIAKDPYYKCVAKGRADLFWKAHTKNFTIISRIQGSC